MKAGSYTAPPTNIAMMKPQLIASGSPGRAPAAIRNRGPARESEIEYERLIRPAGASPPPRTADDAVEEEYRRTATSDVPASTNASKCHLHYHKNAGGNRTSGRRPMWSGQRATGKIEADDRYRPDKNSGWIIARRSTRNRETKRGEYGIIKPGVEKHPECHEKKSPVGIGRGSGLLGVWEQT